MVEIKLEINAHNLLLTQNKESKRPNNICRVTLTWCCWKVNKLQMVKVNKKQNRYKKKYTITCIHKII